MKVVYAGYDFFSSCLAELVGRKDVQVVLCLTGDPNETVKNVVRICREEAIPVLFGRPTAATVAAVNSINADLLVCAAYSYRIPIERMTIPRALNLHPSLLPEGRGPNPIPYLVGDKRQFSGLSAHVLTSEFDSGPILGRSPIELAPDDGFDEMALKLFAAAPILLSAILTDVEGYFDKATPQEHGSYWSAHTEDERIIKAAQATVADIREAIRTFGALGIIVELDDGVRIETSQLTATSCRHRMVPGRIVATLTNGSMISLTDGLARVHT